MLAIKVSTSILINVLTGKREKKEDKSEEKCIRNSGSE